MLLSSVSKVLLTPLRTQIKAKDIVELLASVLDSPYVNSHIRQWVLTSFAKLTTRITDTSEQARIESILARYDTSVEVEIQQRAVEFRALLARKDICAGVLEPMPPPEIRATVVGTVSEKRAVGSTRSDLLDLMGDEMPASNSAAAAPGAPVAQQQQSTQDLLADIFGGMGMEASAAPVATPVQAQKSSMSDIMGLFGDSPAAPAAPPSSGLGDLSGLSGLGGMSSPPPPAAASSGLGGLDIFGASSPSAPTPAAAPAPAPKPTPAAPPAAAAPAYTAYDQKGLRITLTPSVSAARRDVVNITAKFEATAGGEIEGVNFQAAVPKVSRRASCIRGSP